VLGELGKRMHDTEHAGDDSTKTNRTPRTRFPPICVMTAGVSLDLSDSHRSVGVLYLAFNEGYTASSGPSLHRVGLTTQPIRLTRQLHHHLPRDGEVAGLLALMLLTDARRPARTRANGAFVPLADQDRARWDTFAITEGTALITAAMAEAPIGPYQLQAAIAAVHAEAAHAEDTDWPQILGLCTCCATSHPAPWSPLNRIVAVAMVHGPHTALDQPSTSSSSHR
jgi:predicted RNA polymerase sigma factor